MILKKLSFFLILYASSMGLCAQDYQASATLPQGLWEVKLFNNLYSQTALQQRSTFFTSSIQALYGINDRFNIGVTSRLRRTSRDIGDSSPFDVFAGGDGPVRSGITGMGPLLRLTPKESWKRLSIQAYVLFPLGNDLDGRKGNLFIDWSGPVVGVQLLSDKRLSGKFNLFTEFGILIEDIGKKDQHVNRFSSPLTLILNYYPQHRSTLYLLTTYSPYYLKNYDYYYQLGLGAKYSLNAHLEIEVLYSIFRNEFLNTVQGEASTYNLGFRISL